MLTERGAMVLDFPMIKILPVELTGEIKANLQNIANYQWLIFTSKNGVVFFFKFLSRLHIKVDELAAVKIAVVGKKTAEEVVKNNCKSYCISSGNTSEDLLKELVGKIEPGEKMLLVLGELAGNTLEDGLSKRNTINRINVYKTVPADAVSTEVLERIKKDDYHLILFTSPSGFRFFYKLMLDNKITGNFRTACIGQTTEKEMLRNNCSPLVVSSKSTDESFVEALEQFFLT